MLYCAGRFWIEALRIDSVNEIGGFRLNNYTSLIVFLAALGSPKHSTPGEHVNGTGIPRAREGEALSDHGHHQ
jgi:hypothetical protein